LKSQEQPTPAFQSREQPARDDEIPGGYPLPELDADTATEVELRVKYAGYVRREEASVARALRLEHHRLPAEMEYGALHGLRTEAKAQLARVQPRTVGQASRVPGVTPADIAILLVHLERTRAGGAHPSRSSSE
jgi:tRNA uridine 5-carboxymethylaminomethyl modification enzyme